MEKNRSTSSNKVTSLRILPELHEQLKAQAARENRSASNLINIILRDGLKSRAKKVRDGSQVTELEKTGASIRPVNVVLAMKVYDGIKRQAEIEGRPAANLIQILLREGVTYRRRESMKRISEGAQNVQFFD